MATPDLSKMSDQQLADMADKLERGIPVDATARPDYGPHAYETADGAVVQPKAANAQGDLVQVLKQGQQNRIGSDQFGKIRLLIRNGVAAQQQAYALEDWSKGKPSNPYNENYIASNFGDMPGMLTPLAGAARAGASPKLKQYSQTMKTHEEALGPIIAGANFTGSEAERLQGSMITRYGDDSKTMAQKALARARMYNEAARQVGLPVPFPHAEGPHFAEAGSPWAPQAQQGGPGRSPAPAAPAAGRGQTVRTKSGATVTVTPVG